MKSASNLIYLDIEASGLADDSYPIEVAVLIDQQVHEWLIRPLAHWEHWDTDAENNYHNISRNELIEKGAAPDLVAKHLNDLLHGKIAYSDAEPWDAKWIKRLFTDTEITQEFQIHPIQDLMSPNRAVRFGLAKETLQKDRKIKHRAAADALQLAALAKRFIGGDLTG